MAIGRYRGVVGVARKVTKRHKVVDGVSHTIIIGYRGVSGVARKYWENLISLVGTTKNGRNGTVSVYRSGTSLIAEASGGSGENYARAFYYLGQGSRYVSIKAGQTVTFSFAGTRLGSYCDYGIIFYKEGGSYKEGEGDRLATFTDTSYNNASWTATEDCWVYAFAQVGGIDNANLYATFTLTKFEVDGVSYMPS